MIKLLLFIMPFTQAKDTIDWPFKPEDQKLFAKINEIRADKNLPAIAYSDSLSYVASSHNVDLIVAYKDTTCNLHSWSKYGDWTPGCLNPTTGDISVMTHKPWELIRMPVLGFEMVHLHADKESPCDASSALSSFLSKKMFRDMILERGYPRWKRMGVSIFKGAASVWMAYE